MATKVVRGCFIISIGIREKENDEQEAQQKYESCMLSGMQTRDTENYLCA